GEQLADEFQAQAAVCAGDQGGAGSGVHAGSMHQVRSWRRFDRYQWPAPAGRAAPYHQGLTSKEEPMSTFKTLPRRGTLLALALAAAMGTAAPLAWAEAPPATANAGVDIAYEEFTLPNGLRVVVH